MTASILGQDPTPPPTVTFTISPIGLVHTTAKKHVRIPKYFVPKGPATLEIFQPYLSGLEGLYLGLDLWVVTYHAPSAQASAGQEKPGDEAPGMFATNTTRRPNPIDFLRTRVLELDPEKGRLKVLGLDLEDGAPILDLRPALSPHQRLALPRE